MRVTVKRLLFEAFRRNKLADKRQKSKVLCSRWLGLGTAAAYRPVLEADLMEFHGETPPPRCMGWLRLTEEGRTALHKCHDEFQETWEAIESKERDSLRGQFMLAGGLTA